MSNLSEAFVGLDTSKLRNSVAIAEGGRTGEVRFLGEIDTTPAAIRKLVKKLATKYERLSFCYEAGPTGYGAYRQITGLGHDCIVAAPSLIPKKPGDRVKTNRRDAVTLAKLHRAGELTRCGCRTVVTRRCVKSHVRARRRCWICAASASRYQHSCCGRACIMRLRRKRGPRRTWIGLPAR